MYNSSGSTLSLTKNKFIKIVPAKKERKKRKKKEKWKDFRSWNAPVFCKVNEWLQHWGRSPEGGQRNLDSQSSKFPLKHKEESEGGVRTLGVREIMSVGVWLWNWNSKASICLQNLCFSSTKFSFQSSDRFKMKMGVCCVALCCVTGKWIVTETQVPDARGSVFAHCHCYLFFVGCTPDHSPLRLPNTRTKLWS